MRRCAPTSRRASSSAPAMPAAWPTRSATTSRCCSSRRPGGPPRAADDRRPGPVGGGGGVRAGGGPPRHARGGRGGRSRRHAAPGGLRGGPGAHRAAVVRGNGPVGAHPGRQAPCDRGGGPRRLRHRRGDARRRDRGRQPGPGGAVVSGPAARLGGCGRRGHRGVVLGRHRADPGGGGRGGAARLPAGLRGRRGLAAAPDRRAGPRRVRPGARRRPGEVGAVGPGRPAAGDRGAARRGQHRRAGLRAHREAAGGGLASVQAGQRVVRQPRQVAGPGPARRAAGDLGHVAARRGGGPAVRRTAQPERQVPGGRRHAARGGLQPAGGLRRPGRRGPRPRRLRGHAAGAGRRPGGGSAGLGPAGRGQRPRRPPRHRGVRAGHGRRPAPAGPAGRRHPAHRLREHVPGHRIRDRPGALGGDAGPGRADRVGAGGYGAAMRAAFAALAANLGIAATKFGAFVLTGSASMLAESVHSVADTGNELLLIIGRNRANRPRSEQHPFGFGRERYFYGFVVAVMLFTIGATFSVFDGIRKILAPEPVHDAKVAFIVLGASVVLEAFSLRTGISEANRVRGGRGWGAFIRRTKAPELPVVLIEDVAALIGLGFAFAGVALAALTGDGRWDGAGSLAIGALLATAAAILAVETKSLLIGESASAEMQRLILAALEDGPQRLQVIHLRTLHMSPDSLLVTAKIAVRGDEPAAQLAAAIDAAERRVRAVVPIARTIYLEPDIYREAMADRTDPSIQAVLRGRFAPRRPGRPGSNK